MEIHREQAATNTIQSYSKHNVKVNGKVYESSLIIQSEQITHPWSISSLNELNHKSLDPIIKSKPEVILFGQENPTQLPPMWVREQLSKIPIGLECMTIGAACRTFNVLLSENRRVILGLIFNNKHP